MNIPKEISTSFMIANLIAMVLVVAIHYDSKGSIVISSGYGINYIIQEAFINGFARSAVPIFALLSGFFLIKKVATSYEYRLTLINKTYTLLVPYLIASILIFSSSIFLKILFNQEQSQRLDLYSIIYSVLAHPVSEQFWFLRDLIILIIISPLLFNMNKLIFYGIGSFLFFLWVMDIQPFPIIAGWYLLNIETIFFFWFGGMLFKSALDIESFIFCNITTRVVVMILWVGLIALRIYIDPDLDVWYVKNYTVESILLYKAAIFVGVVSILQLSTIMRNNRFLIYTSGLTFFVFLFHLKPLSYFRHFTNQLLETPYLFYLNFPLALFLVFIFAHFTSKYFGRLFNLTCGGRSPNKALQRTD